MPPSAGSLALVEGSAEASRGGRDGQGEIRGRSGEIKGDHGRDGQGGWGVGRARGVAGVGWGSRLELSPSEGLQPGEVVLVTAWRSGAAKGEK